MNKIITNGHLPFNPTGKIEALPSVATTMYTSTARCPRKVDHIVTESSHRFYCRQCGNYWDKL